MWPWHVNEKKSATRLIKRLNKSIIALRADNYQTFMIQQILQIHLSTIKNAFIATTSSDIYLKALCRDICKRKTMYLLIFTLPHLDLDYKKCVSFIFTNMFSILKYHTVKYMRNHPKILLALLSKYQTHEWDVVFNYGIMLRQCVQHEVLAKIILKSNEFLKLFEYLKHQRFDISMDVFFNTSTIINNTQKNVC